MLSRQETILVLSNSNWNISNFRSSFISFLREENKTYVASFKGQSKINLDGISFVELPDLKRNTLSIKSAMMFIGSLSKIVAGNDITRIYVFTFYLSALTMLLKYFPVGKRVHIRAIITGLGKLYTSKNVVLNLIFYFGVFLLKRADSIVVQNKSDYKFLCRYISISKITLVPGSGVSLKDTRLEPSPLNQLSSMTYCYVGRLLKSKGVDIIVKAFQKYLQYFPNDKLLIVGDYDSNDKRFRIEANEKNIEVYGWTDNVTEIFIESHATLLMSDREGMPKTLLESIANCTPIIAYGAPGVEDIYEYAGLNEVGIIVEERNVESLVIALQKFRMLDPEKYKMMAMNGRHLANNVFSDEVINKSLK